MGKVRIWYHNDEKISVSHPDKRPEKKPKGLSMDEWALEQFENVLVKVPRFQGLDFEDINPSQLPQDRKDRNRWRGTKAQGIKVDSTVVLRQDLLDQLDAELDKPNSDLKKALKLQRRIDKKEHD